MISLYTLRMALIRYKSGQAISVSPQKGGRLWRLWKGEVETSNAEEVAEVANIKAIYLNRENAPESYIIAREHVWNPPSNQQPNLWQQRKDFA